MKYRITTTIAALALGAAVASPALAQQYGRSPNDGGTISSQQPSSQPLYNSAAPQTPAAPQIGRAANDGGMVSEPSGAQAAAAKPQTTAQQSSPPHYGRAPNDGGM